MLPRLFILATLALPTLLVAVPAEAQATIVLSMGGDGSAELSAEARRAVVSALEAEEVPLVPEGEVAHRIAPARLRALASLDDVRSIAFELEARVAVTVSVWLREEVEPPEAASVVVTVLAGARSFTATVDVTDEVGLEAAARAALADARGQQTQAAITSGVVSDEPLRPAREDDDDDDDDGSAAGSSGSGSSSSSSEERSMQDQIFDVAGPTMLGAFGAAGVGMGVYALLDGSCARYAPISGECLRGELPNTPAGVVLVTAGVLAMAGAVVWLIVGAQSAEIAPIDLVIAPEGTELRVRGRF